MAEVSLLVNGIVYLCGSNQKYAYYCYVDSFGLLWQVSRRLDSPASEPWQASVHEVQNEFRDMILMQGEEPFQLLEGLSELIKLSNWVRQARIPKEGPSPLLTVEPLEGGRAEIQIRCRNCNNIARLVVESFDLLTRQPDTARLVEFPDLVPAITGVLQNGICPVCSIWSEDKNKQTGEEEIP